MENIKSSIIIIMVISSFLSCKTEVKHDNNINLVFEFNQGEKIFKNPLICFRNSKFMYFGLSNSDVTKIDAKSLKMITVRNNNKEIIRAKPVGTLSSNLPDTKSFFTISYDSTSIEGYLEKSGVFWFRILNNPNNNDGVSEVLEDIKGIKCSW